MYLGGLYGGGTLRPVALGLVLLPLTLPNPMGEMPYAQQLLAFGGVRPYTFALTSGNLPTGLSLSSTGLIGGTPASSSTLLPNPWPIGTVDAPYGFPLVLQETGVGGSSTFTVGVTDGVGTTAANPYTLTVQSGWANAFYQVDAHGPLPTCLKLSDTGFVSGCFCRVGTWTVLIDVINMLGATKAYTFTITAQPFPLRGQANP